MNDNAKDFIKGLISNTRKKEEKMFGMLKKAAMAAVFLGLGSVGAHAADTYVNLGVSGGAAVPNQAGAGTGDMVYIYNNSSDTTIVNTNPAAVVGIGNNLNDNVTYAIGAQGSSGTDYLESNGKVNVTLEGLQLRGNVLDIVSSVRLNNEGTIVNLTNTTLNATLDANQGGTINIQDSVSNVDGRYNVLTTETLTASGLSGFDTSINVGANSLFHVKNAAALGSATGDAVNFALGDEYTAGRLQFDNGMTLRNGSITGNGDITGNVTLSGNNLGAITATVNASGKDQIYRGNLAIGSGGGQIIVGYSGVASESNLQVTGRLTVNGGQANSFVSIGGTDSTTMGTLTTKDIALVNGGTVNVGEYGKLVVGNAKSTSTSNITDGYINVGVNGEALFNNKISLNGNSAITADGGTVVFANDVQMQSGAMLNIINGGTMDISKVGTLSSGRIFVSDIDNELVVGNGLTLNNASAIVFDGSVVDNTLTVARTDNGALGKLSIARSNAIDFSNAGGTSTLNVGDMTILGTANGNLYTGAFNQAEINALTFTVAKGANVRGHAGVTTTVERLALIQGKYDTAGTEVFERGLQVNSGGELTAGIGSANIKVGNAAVRAANVLVNNGTLSSSAGNVLTLTNVNSKYNSNLVFSGTNNKVQGTVVATGTAGSAFGINVDGNLNLAKNYTSLTGTTYSQTGGTVQSYDGRFQTINVTGNKVSTITGPTSVFAVSANFGPGVSFTNGATLRGVTSHTIALTGNGAATSNLSMDKSTLLDLSFGDIKVTGYRNVNILGTMRLGFIGGQTTMLDSSGSYRTTANLRNIQLSEDFVNGYDFSVNGINDYIFYDNTVTTKPATSAYTVKNVFGDYSFRYVEGDGAWLESVNAKDITNVDGVRSSLAEKWGMKRTSTGFASNVSAVAQNIRNPGFGARPYATAAGNLNYNILKSYAMGYDTYGFSFGGKSYSGTIDKGLLAAYNGSTASGPIYIAQDVTREIATTLHSRMADVRDLQKELDETVASTTALGSMSVTECLNNQYLNRFWVGGLGMWQDASQRKEFDGYKYDGAGGILGYDRAFGTNGAFIGGLSVAYMEGDYEDKTATSHDSKIKNYAADAYLTYNSCSGVFASIMGGYNYSDNDLREMRGSNWASEDYHTNTWHVGGKIGYDFAASENFTISPSVGANFYYSRSNEHQMVISNTNMLSYGEMKNNNVELPIEVRMAYAVNLGEQKDLTFMANGGYAYNLNDHGVNGSVGINDVYGVIPMRAVGRQLGHHAWTAGVGVKYRMGQMDLGVKYDYAGRSNFDGHRLMGTVGYSF